MNLDTPEGRYAASQALGHEGYNAAMAAHHKANSVATVNGYNLRWVNTRFGNLCNVDGTNVAFRTVEEATAHAKTLPALRSISLQFTPREDSFLIAAIRLWQQIERGTFDLIDKDGRRFSVDHFEDIASCAGEYPALSPVEVDDMACEIFGLDPWLTEEERNDLSPPTV